MDEHIFISFDCAYRTLGWCILGYNPQRAIHATCAKEAREVFRLIAGGVEDVLGSEIISVEHQKRAELLGETLDRIIPRELVPRATVIIEHQPRQQSVRGRGSVRADNIVVEAQLTMYFTVHARAAHVYLIEAKMKDRISSAILREPIGGVYAERKKQSRRAYIQLTETFDFSAHVAEKRAGSADRGTRGIELKHIKADQSDACLQILGAIFLCSKSIQWRQ